MVCKLYTYKNMRCILFLLLIFIVLILNSNLPWLDHVILCRLLIGGHGFSRSKLLLRWWILATIFCFVNFLSLFYPLLERRK